eukprot:m.26537 g.26537  ORF g.26537 m.26537 type:complete len:1015 (-) comp7806_c0_seq2:174-3218(-)
MRPSKALVVVLLLATTIDRCRASCFRTTSKIGDKLDCSFGAFNKTAGFADIADPGKIIDMVLDNNLLTHLHDGMFAPFSGLEYLSIIENKLSVIHAEVFTDANLALEILDLSDNLLTDIAPGAFSPLKSLLEIYLTKNSLTRFTPGMFAGNTKLTIIHMEDNLITSVPGGSFNGHRSLESLYLGKNDIKFVNQTAFSNLNRVTTLDLSDNLITSLGRDTFTSLEQLKNLILSENDITSVEFDTGKLYQLQTLSLSGNEIKRVTPEMWKGLDELKTLFLENNEITSIPSKTFSSLSDLKTLKINDNKIDAVSRDAFPPQSLTFSMEDNPIVCSAMLSNCSCSSPLVLVIKDGSTACQRETTTLTTKTSSTTTSSFSTESDTSSTTTSTGSTFSSKVVETSKTSTTTTSSPTVISSTLITSQTKITTLPPLIVVGFSTTPKILDTTKTAKKMGSKEAPGGSSDESKNNAVIAVVVILLLVACLVLVLVYIKRKRDKERTKESLEEELGERRSTIEMAMNPLHQAQLSRKPTDPAPPGPTRENSDIVTDDNYVVVNDYDDALLANNLGDEQGATSQSEPVACEYDNVSSRNVLSSAPQYTSITDNECNASPGDMQPSTLEYHSIPDEDEPIEYEDPDKMAKEPIMYEDVLINNDFDYRAISEDVFVGDTTRRGTVSSQYNEVVLIEEENVEKETAYVSGANDENGAYMSGAQEDAIYMSGAKSDADNTFKEDESNSYMSGAQEDAIYMSGSMEDRKDEDLNAVYMSGAQDDAIYMSGGQAGTIGAHNGIETGDIDAMYTSGAASVGNATENEDIYRSGGNQDTGDIYTSGAKEEDSEGLYMSGANNSEQDSTYAFPQFRKPSHNVSDASGYDVLTVNPDAAPSPEHIYQSLKAAGASSAQLIPGSYNMHSAYVEHNPESFSAGNDVPDGSMDSSYGVLTNQATSSATSGYHILSGAGEKGGYKKLEAHTEPTTSGYNSLSAVQQATAAKLAARDETESSSMSARMAEASNLEDGDFC